jgi:uncharacterized protein (DUF885 family)
VTAFDDLAARFLDDVFAADPVTATLIGDHRFDDRWPDMSDPGRLGRLALYERWTAALDGLDPASLTSDQRIDRDLVLGELARHRFVEGELREDAWDPLGWVYLMGAGLHALIARDFAPLAIRLANLASRLEGVPGIITDAQAVIGSHPARQVSRTHARVAGERISGVAALGDEAVATAEAAAPGDAAVAAILPRLRAANETARAALNGIGEHLRTQVAAQAQGPAELGRELYAAKLRYTLADPTVTPEAILARAEHEYGVVRAEMVRLAREMWPQWCPNRAMPDDEGALVRAVLDAVALEHPRAEDLVDVCRGLVADIEAFCREHDVIGLADDPLEVQWTPEFMRSFAGAMLEAPGPLDVGQKTFYSITPARPEWGPDEIESWLRELSDRQLKLLTIHEAVPGHYLQGAYANRSGGSLLRRVFGSGLFAEGWAVYVTQVMLDRGYAGDDLALWLSHWKFYLRAVVNTILDVRIHCFGMTSEEAIALMVDGAFQERSEAEAKDERARLTATQLSTYFLGSVGCWDIEDEARRRAAEASGAGQASVPVPALVGGYPPTTGFDERAHLEAVISHGEPPIPLLRRMLLGEG